MMQVNTTQQERLLAHLEAHCIARPRELKRIGIAANTISRAVDAGLVRRTGRGLYELAYSDWSEHITKVQVAKRVPDSVLCLTSALSFHELTSIIPREMWIAVPNKAWRPKLNTPPVRIVRIREPYFSNGVETHRFDGTDLRVHSITKAIADAFRLPGLVDLAVALESMKTAIRDDLATPGEIADAAIENGSWKRMEPYLEAMSITD